MAEINIEKMSHNVAEKAIQELRDNGVFVSRWIPVSERLPASDDDVLVTNGIGMYIGWIDPTDKCWRVDSASEYFMTDIIAWIPLPEPYKAESEVEE